MQKLRDESRMFAEMLDSCNDKIKHRPEDTRSIRLRSVIYTVDKMYDEAIADLNVVLKRSPEDMSAYYLRADCYFNIEEYDLAKQDYLRALKI